MQQKIDIRMHHSFTNYSFLFVFQKEDTVSLLRFLTFNNNAVGIYLLKVNNRKLEQ